MFFSFSGLGLIQVHIVYKQKWVLNSHFQILKSILFPEQVLDVAEFACAHLLLKSWLCPCLWKWWSVFYPYPARALMGPEQTSFCAEVFPTVSPWVSWGSRPCCMCSFWKRGFSFCQPSYFSRGQGGTRDRSLSVFSASHFLHFTLKMPLKMEYNKEWYKCI